MNDFRSIIRSPEFHFSVGRERRRLTVHTEIIRTLSPPLFALINNGMMKESIEGYAVLEEVDELTFTGFCEFAYRGAYSTPDRYETDEISPDDQSGISQRNEQDATEDHPEIVTTEEQSQQIEAEPEPEESESAPVEECISTYDHRPVHMNDWDMYTTKRKWISFRKKAAYGIPLPKKEACVTHVHYPYDGLWKQFRELHFAGDEASPSTVPDLVFHGKLYVFADRYLIGSLRTQCLKSLHRDLCEFSLNRRNTSHVLDLLEYAYQESGRGSPDGEISLKNLVVHYAACEARTLAEDPRLRDILIRFSEMGSDLIMKLIN